MRNANDKIGTCLTCGEDVLPSEQWYRRWEGVVHSECPEPFCAESIINVQTPDQISPHAAEYRAMLISWLNQLTTFERDVVPLAQSDALRDAVAQSRINVRNALQQSLGWLEGVEETARGIWEDIGNRGRND